MCRLYSALKKIYSINIYSKKYIYIKLYLNVHLRKLEEENSKEIQRKKVIRVRANINEIKKGISMKV